MAALETGSSKLAGSSGEGGACAPPMTFSYVNVSFFLFEFYVYIVPSTKWELLYVTVNQLSRQFNIKLSWVLWWPRVAKFLVFCIGTHLIGLQRFLRPYTIFTWWKLWMPFMDFAHPESETFQPPNEKYSFS